MVHLNRNELESHQLDKLLDELSKKLSHVPSSKMSIFLSELLGAEERVMLAKRLAIIVLLLEKYSLYEIGSLLKVSPATARNLKQKLEACELENVVREISSNKNVYLELFTALDSILHLGGALPRYKTHRSTTKNLSID
jgi:Trp operon repressor